jgi:hypothetical protein
VYNLLVFLTRRQRGSKRWKNSFSTRCDSTRIISVKDGSSQRFHSITLHSLSNRKQEHNITVIERLERPINDGDRQLLGVPELDNVLWSYENTKDDDDDKQPQKVVDEVDQLRHQMCRESLGFVVLVVKRKAGKLAY